MRTWEFQTRVYLEEVQKKELLISDLMAEQERLNQKIYSVGTPNQTGVRSQNPDQIVDNIIRISEQKEKLSAAISENASFRLQVVEEIHKLPDEKEKKVLYQHYMKNKTFRIIADEMSVTYDYVTRIHRKAIRSFYVRNQESVLNYHQSKIKK